MAERLFIRILVSVCLSIALLAFVVLPIPADLPPPAFEQVGLYRLEAALLVFYGSLLLVTPAFSGLIRGRLPTEISVRGAKFKEETDQSANRNEVTIKRLEQRVRHLDDRLTLTQIELNQLKGQVTVSDQR